MNGARTTVESSGPPPFDARDRLLLPLERKPGAANEFVVRYGPYGALYFRGEDSVIVPSGMADDPEFGGHQTISAKLLFNKLAEIVKRQR